MNYLAMFGGPYPPQMRQPMMGGQTQPQFGGNAPMQQAVPSMAGPSQPIPSYGGNMLVGGPMQPQPMRAPSFGGNALATMVNPMQTGGAVMPTQQPPRQPRGMQAPLPGPGVMRYGSPDRRAIR